MKIDIEAHKKEGMYLYFPDGTFLDLSRERIQALSEAYWNSPEKLPQHMRDQEAFRTCEICPYRGQNVLCSAMKPLLPFLEEMERFVSFDKVAVVYVHEGIAHYVPEATMQQALQYVTMMALFEYCEEGKEYHGYFRGIHPFMSEAEAQARLIMNVFWAEKGDQKRVEDAILRMEKMIKTTSRSCVKRLNVLCKSDVFMNAYILTQSFVTALAMNIHRVMKEQMQQGSVQAASHRGS